jgi:hypothetical protein
MADSVPVRRDSVSYGHQRAGRVERFGRLLYYPLRMPDRPTNLNVAGLTVPVAHADKAPAEMRAWATELIAYVNRAFNATAAQNSAQTGAKGTVSIVTPEGFKGPPLHVAKGRIIIENVGGKLNDKTDRNAIPTWGDIDDMLSCDWLVKRLSNCQDEPDTGTGQVQSACQSPALKQLSVTPLSNIDGPQVVLGGAYAYVAGLTPAGAFHTLQVWNIDNTGAPSLAAPFVSGVAAGSGALGLRKAVRQGRYLFAQEGGGAFNDQIAVWDIYDAANCFVTATISAGSGANDMFPNGRYIYVANDQGVARFDTSAPGDVVNPGPNVTPIFPTAGPQFYRDLAGIDGFLYCTNIDASSVDSFAIYDPANPHQVGQLVLGGQLFGIAVIPGFAFTTNGTDTLYVIDIHDPTSPQLVGTPTTFASTFIQSCLADGDNLILTGPAGQTLLFEITDRSSPQLLATDTTGVNFPALEGRNLVGVI